MAIRNQIMLITYPDSMGKNLKELSEILDEHFRGIIGGLHILPFFPSSADRGFAPTTYETVDPTFGDWNDIRALADRYYLMFDFMINHISRRSAYFQDFIQKKDQSAYKDMFIRYRDFWPGGEPTQKDVDLIYKRKPRAPYAIMRFRNNYPAFGGDVSVGDAGSSNELTIRWTKGKYVAKLHADLRTCRFEITYAGENGAQEKLALG